MMKNRKIATKMVMVLGGIALVQMAIQLYVVAGSRRFISGLMNFSNQRPLVWRCDL